MISACGSMRRPDLGDAPDRSPERGMVSQTRHGARRFRFVLRPNRSLSWSQAKLVLLMLGAVPLSVSLALAWQGMWPVLPFAGAEFLALWLAFHVCARRGDALEVVTVDEHAVAIEKGRRYPQQMWNMPRAWAEVSLQPSHHAGHPSRLLLRSHGHVVGLGDFLTEEERTNFAGALRSALASD